MLFWLRILVIFLTINGSISESNSELSKRVKKANIFQLFFNGLTNRKCNCKCGLPNRRGRLLGGTNLIPYEFPWLVIIRAKGLLGIPGSILNDKYVITAASSLIGLTPYELKIDFGVHDTCNPDVTSLTISVSDIFIHPEFLYENRLNDLAILKLTTFIPYGKHYSPICLPTPGSHYTDQVIIIGSWINGLTSDNLTLTSCVPRKIGLPVLDEKICSSDYSQGCIGIVGASSVLCKSDAGAGLYYQSRLGYYELVGILSDRQNCRFPPTLNDTLKNNEDFRLPIFTRLSGNNLNWLLEHTKDGCYCNKL